MSTRENQAAVEDAAHFELALLAQHERQLGAGFAKKCLAVVLWLSIALVIASSIIAYMGYLIAHQPIKYFATENGRVVPLVPRDQPGLSQNDVAAFGAETLRESFTLDFVHYRDQMTRVANRYNDDGFKGYYNALTSSNVLAAVKDQRMNLSVEVGPGVIRSKGLLGGIYTWEFQYPVTLKLDGQQTSSPAQRFIFTTRIQRADVEEKPLGLEMTQVISTSV